MSASTSQAAWLDCCSMRKLVSLWVARSTASKASTLVGVSTVTVPLLSGRTAVTGVLIRTSVNAVEELVVARVFE